MFKSNSSPVGASWMWTLAFGHHEDRTPTHGYAATRAAPSPKVGGGSEYVTFRCCRRHRTTVNYCGLSQLGFHAPPSVTLHCGPSKTSRWFSLTWASVP